MRFGVSIICIADKHDSHLSRSGKSSRRGKIRMEVLRFFRRHCAALITIVIALGIVMFSNGQANAHASHDGKLQPLLVVPQGDPLTINIQNFAFAPNNPQVTVGTVVTWVNLDSAPHTATSTSGPVSFNSGTLAQNQTFSFTFTQVGTYQYRCNIHTSMLGSITVVDVSTATPTATPTSNLVTNTNTNTPTATGTATGTLTATNSPTNTTGQPTFTRTNTPVPSRPDTIGVYKDGVFYLRNTNTTGPADITVAFGGDVSDYPVAGDWNGDSVDSIGVYRSSTGQFFLSDSNTAPTVAYTLVFGNPGDRPFAGRWTADMGIRSGVGVYRNSNGILYQKKQLTTGVDDFFAIFGNPDDLPLAGDWDNNGFDSIGVFRSSNQTYYLSNNSTPGGITFSDINLAMGATGRPVGGDWDADGDSSPGWLESLGLYVLYPSVAPSGSRTYIAFGPNDAYPVAGKWTAPSRPAPLTGVQVEGQPNGANGGSDGGGD
jgi:plastocyanin